MVSSIRGFAQRHSSRLIRGGAVTALLVSLLAVGYLAAAWPRLAPLTLAAVLALLVAFAVVRRIEIGLVAMLLAGVFVRFRLPTGTASEIVISLLLCGGVLALWVIRMLMVDKRLALKPTPVNAPLLGFVVAVFVSLGWGSVYRDVFVHDVGSPFVAIASAVVMALLPAVLILVVNLVQDLRWLQAMVWIFLAEGLVSLVVSVIVDLGIGPTDTIRRLVFYNGFVWINTHGLFSMWYTSFALALALFNKRLHWGWRAALLVYVAGWVYWGFWQRTSWLSGWVPVFAVMAVIAFLRSKWLFIVLAVVGIIGAGGYYWRTEFQVESEQSGETRLAAYEVNWRVTSKHLLFGTGPAGYASYYMSYFPMEGMASHSNYIDIIAQTGIVGTFFILWFFGVQVQGGYKMWRKFQNCGGFVESVIVAVLGGTVGCIVAMALGDWLFPFAYTQSIAGFDAAMLNWFFMGMLWALSHILTLKPGEANGLPLAEEVTT